MALISNLRQKLSTTIIEKLLAREFTIISDDCWAGQFYKQFNLPYLTPTVGLFIASQDYLKYIREFDKIHKENLIFIESNRDYPVATLSGIEIHFMHFKNAAEAQQKYWRRYKRIKNDKILIKIDFGKSYTTSDIDAWNQLNLKNSLALYPSSIEVPKEGVHNGVAIQDWQLDGAAMFNISRKYFDIFTWVRKGIIRNGFLYRMLNTHLLEY